MDDRGRLNFRRCHSFDVSWFHEFCDFKGFLLFNISRCSHGTWNRLDDRGRLNFRRCHSFDVSWFHEFCDFKGFVVFIGFVGFVIRGFIKRDSGESDFMRTFRMPWVL